MFNFVKKKKSKVNKDLDFETYNDLKFLELQIHKFKISKNRQDMFVGEKYYCGLHDILQRKRTVIGADGSLEEIDNLPNNKIIDNQYSKIVDQKNNYLLGKPFSIQCENRKYTSYLKNIFDKKFLRLLRNLGEDSLNHGISWLYLYYDEFSNLQFENFKATEVIPIWEDLSHTKLKQVIRIYSVAEFISNKEKITEKVEVYDTSGIRFFELNNGKLKHVAPYHKSYLTINNQNYNFDKIPIIPFKYNNKEIPLINKVNSLQDAINFIQSDFQNKMEEDTHNTILVLVNYDGENLGEFRKNLATYGAVKVKTVDGAGGDLKTLQVEVNGENYKLILHILKKALIENAMGFDAKDDRMSGNPNQMNILSMYSDIDLDANSMETEFQASFEEILYFVNNHLHNLGFGNFSSESVDIIFNRDVMVRETEVVDNALKSLNILSRETIVAKHPWVKDTNEELLRIENENNNTLLTT